MDPSDIGFGVASRTNETLFLVRTNMPTHPTGGYQLTTTIISSFDTQFIEIPFVFFY